MEVRPDLKDKIAAACSTIPTSAMHMLLKAALPKTVMPSMKSPEYKFNLHKELVQKLADELATDMNAKVEANEANARNFLEIKSRKVKTRAPRSVAYRILVPDAHRNHNPNTNRYWMAWATCHSRGGGGTRNLRYAQAALERNLPADMRTGAAPKLDLAWLLRIGYIELINEGEE